MDSKCILVNINKNNSAFKWSENKLISFGGFCRRPWLGGPHGQEVPRLPLHKKPQRFPLSQLTCSCPPFGGIFTQKGL